MLLFGHWGITLGTAALSACASDRFRKTNPNPTRNSTINTGVVSGWFTSVLGATEACFETLGRKVDIRAIFLGSLLPDIIDKPIGNGLLASSLNNGRIFAHSLLFLFIVLMAGLLVYRRYRNSFFLVVAFGVMIHSILDSMWVDPHSLFWPFLGVAFAKGGPDNFFVMIFQSAHKPSYFVVEIVGFVIVCAFGLWLVRKKQVTRFLRTGTVN